MVVLIMVTPPPQVLLWSTQRLIWYDASWKEYSRVNLHAV